jgi:hypothetical protein
VVEEERHAEITAELDDMDDTFYFIQGPIEPAIGEAGPSNTGKTSRHIPMKRHLEEEEDSRVEETHPTAGAVIRMHDHLHAKWQKHFGNQYHDGDVDMDEGDEDKRLFFPFASELDWNVANWAVKDGPGHKAFDRLLSIPGVRLLHLQRPLPC